jgi:tetratricopeptide (TPR) repeat protein
MSAPYPLVRNLYAFSTRFGVSRRPSRPGSSPSSASSFLISSCIVLFYLSATAAPSIQTGDTFYADRANLESARRAAQAYAEELARDPKSYEAAWKLARACYWLGGHAPEAERRKFLEDGIEAGKKAAAVEPNRPEGHFWIGANMGALAESYGVRQGVKYRKPIREELETVLKIDPSFMLGSADRALGRWYAEVPRLFGGSKKLAEQHLKESLKYNPDATISHYFLAELYLDDGRKADARAELQKVIDAPLSKEWAPEDQDFKEKAKKLLATIK